MHVQLLLTAKDEPRELQRAGSHRFASRAYDLIERRCRRQLG